MSTTKLTRREQREHAQRIHLIRWRVPLFLIHAAASMFTALKRISASRCVKFSSAQLSSAAIKITPGTETNEPRSRCMTPPGRMATRMLALMSARGWQSCASRGSTRVTTARRSAGERSSAYTKARLADDGLDELRFSGLLTPANAPSLANALPSCTTPARG